MCLITLICYIVIYSNDSNGITPISTDCALFEYGISNTTTLSVDHDHIHISDLQLQLVTDISNQSLPSNPSRLSPLLLSPAVSNVSNTSSNISYDNISNKCHIHRIKDHRKNQREKFHHQNQLI